MPSKLSLPRQGPCNLVFRVFELSEVELTEFHCIQIDLPVFIHFIKEHVPVGSYYQAEITQKLVTADINKLKYILEEKYYVQI